MLKAILGLTALFLAASVPAVCAQDVSPAVLVPPAPAAVVVDGKGRKVGAYFPVVSYGVGTLDLQTNNNVLIQAGTSSGLWFVLPISKQGFIPTGTTTGAGFPPLYYTTADCSGTAYMKPSPGGLTVSSCQLWCRRWPPLLRRPRAY
jgi:hypothetical protein